MHIGPKSLFIRALFCTCIHISIPTGIMGVNPCCCKAFDTRTMTEPFYILETYRTLNRNRYFGKIETFIRYPYEVGIRTYLEMDILKLRTALYTNGMYYSPCRSRRLNLSRSIWNVTVTQAFTHNRTICLIDIHVANVIKSYPIVLTAYIPKILRVWTYRHSI